MGLLRFKVPLFYAEAHNKSSSVWSEHDLWKILMDYGNALGALIVNNKRLFLVFPSYLLDYGPTERDGGLYYVDVDQDLSPSIPIGFVRTCPIPKDVTVPPYVLYADEQNRVSIGGARPITLSKAIPCQDISLYKKLITTNHKAVYMTARGPVFI